MEENPLSKLGSEWSRTIYAIFGPLSLLFLVSTGALYVGAYFSADGSAIQTVLYLLAGLTATGAGAQIYKRYNVTAFHAKVVEVVRASLGRRNLKDVKIEDDLLQLVQSHLSESHNDRE